MKWLTRFLEMDTGPVGEDKWRDYGDSEPRFPRAEYESYAHRNKIDPRREYLEEIEGAAMDVPNQPIDELVQTFCYNKGFITIEGVARRLAQISAGGIERSTGGSNIIGEE